MRSWCRCLTDDANRSSLGLSLLHGPSLIGITSSAQNVAFVSSESTSSTDDVSTAYGVCTSSGYNLQRENSSSYTDELMCSFFANQFSGPHLDHEDLEQLDEFYLEEMDLKWQVAMISMRLKKFYKKIGRKLHFDAKEPVGFDKTKVECYNCHKTGHFAREYRSKGNTGYKSKDNEMRPGKQKEPKALAQTLRSSDVEDSPVHDRFANVEGMHAVPSPMTGNYMPSGPDREVDDSIVETLESVLEPVVVEPKVVSQPKVWSDAPIIEEYESDSDDEYVIQPSKEQERPSFAFVKHVKTPRETVKEQNIYSPSPKADKRDWNGLISKRLGLGYGFTKKACFICGSFSHLIRDCDFHEKRMAKQVELNKKKGKGTGQGENRTSVEHVKRITKTGGYSPRALRNKGIVDSGCSRHMTGNKAYLAEYQDYNGGLVAFGGSKGYIIGKEFKNRDIIEFCGSKGIKRECSHAETHNNWSWLRGKNRTLIETARTNSVISDNQANKTAGPKEANHSAGTQDNIDAGNSEMEVESAQDYFVLPIWSSYTSTVKSSEAKNEGEKPNKNTGLKTNEEPVDQEDQAFLEELERLKRQEKEANDA
ncbi:putative ribonuclease H-like domain-containing protein [Tanacetum coccineum]|uniref:Ribonuclease H-like domain-containing protein n=1 Tax=Tanacetum coccineum TaxID=301880 RepID=A0ABQ5F6Z5_9ASTR